MNLCTSVILSARLRVIPTYMHHTTTPSVVHRFFVYVCHPICGNIYSSYLIQSHRNPLWSHGVYSCAWLICLHPLFRLWGYVLYLLIPITPQSSPTGYGLLSMSITLSYVLYLLISIALLYNRVSHLWFICLHQLFHLWDYVSYLLISITPHSFLITYGLLVCISHSVLRIIPSHIYYIISHFAARIIRTYTHNKTVVYVTCGSNFYIMSFHLRDYMSYLLISTTLNCTL